MPLPSIDIELSSPQSVDGRPAAYQSLWLLVRLHHAQRQGEVVALDALRGQVSSARTLRMVVSRAFRDFKAWGLRVGWGTDAARDPRFLNAEGRSQGPFWLPAAEARRLRLRVDGQPARPADVAAFLGLSASPRRARTSAAAEAQASAVQLQDARFWHQLAAAQQAMRQGRWALPIQGRRDAKAPASALAAMRQAADLAQDDYQRALVTLNEALLWRRLGDDAQARKRLAALQRQRLARQVASHDYLGAMAAIVGAWCGYTARDLPQAQAQLAAMTRDAQQAPLLRHHPQVRFEWSNLWALACRSRALGMAATDAAAATQQADEAMAHFGRALASAFESHNFDAAQHVAANMGMAVWLFDRVGLGVQAAGQARGADARRHAVQWIAFSEWLCSLADGQGRSAWNAIYLMRIARGDCQPRPGLPMADFAALRPLTPRALAEESADRLAPGLDGPATRGGWAGVAARHLADHDAGQRRYPGLQLAGLLFEQAWFAAHDRDLRTAATALTRLRTVLPQLVPSDRAYFRDVWNDALPAELLALEPPPRRSARRAAMG